MTALSQFPAQASTKQLIHFNQLMRSGNFQMFDQGSAAANQAKYGQTTPPIIPINTITKVPVAMFVG